MFGRWPLWSAVTTALGSGPLPHEDPFPWPGFWEQPLSRPGLTGPAWGAAWWAGSALKSELSLACLRVLGCTVSSSLKVAPETPNIVSPLASVLPQALSQPLHGPEDPSHIPGPQESAGEARRPPSCQGSGCGCGAISRSPLLPHLPSSCPACPQPVQEARLQPPGGQRPPHVRASTSPGKAHQETGPGQNVLVCSRDSGLVPVLAAACVAKMAQGSFSRVAKEATCVPWGPGGWLFLGLCPAHTHLSSPFSSSPRPPRSKHRPGEWCPSRDCVLARHRDPAAQSR